jgi:feruloyl-CoA synthase
VFLGDGWWQPTWGEARSAADAIAQSLLDAGLGPARPLMVLSGNLLAHMKLTLAAYTAGVPVLPISPAYSLVSADHERIRSIARLCRPGMAFAEDGEAFEPALAAVAESGAEQVISLDALESGRPGPEVESTSESLGPDTVAKILFTSGSTGPRRASSTRIGCCTPTSRRSGKCGPSSAKSHRCSSTGCRGATRSAATTISARS